MKVSGKNSEPKKAQKKVFSTIIKNSFVPQNHKLTKISPSRMRKQFSFAEIRKKHKFFHIGKSHSDETFKWGIFGLSPTFANMKKMV